PEKRVFDLRVAPLYLTEDSKICGVIGVFFDITKLERLERVRQEFLSNVSHELRTPLTAILASVETLEGGAIDDDQNNRLFLSVITRNARRMHRLIDDILELSAIESGTIEVKPERVMLSSIVNDVTTSLAAYANERKVGLVNSIESSVTVFADPHRLEQMLTNLINNGIKFNTQEGSVTITHERALNGGTWRDCIKVTDTGDGIAPEHMARIFERFYRIDRARSRDAGGTGLGLAIAKHLARAHNGEIVVTSQIGKGSEFRIDLPECH
ncbi:MAG: sensor histidine kinase, partial [Pyrinomonadaceae bacterium]